MKYLIKNRKTGEETLCEKVEVGGYDYYYSKEIHISKGVLIYNSSFNSIVESANDTLVNCKLPNGNFCAKVIATNNKSLDLPQVVDEVEVITEELCTIKFNQNNTIDLNAFGNGVIQGYQKAKETYSYTVQDLMSFNEWYLENEQLSDSYNDLIEWWQEQRVIKIEVE